MLNAANEKIKKYFNLAPKNRGEISCWFALSCLVILPALPRRYVLIDLSAGFGIIFLSYMILRKKITLLPNIHLRTALLFFFGSALVATVYPAINSLPQTKELTECAGTLWNTLRAAIAAGLCLYLVNTREKLITVCFLLVIASFPLLLWAPLDCYLRGLLPYIWEGFYKMVGSKGTGHRYAVVLYFFSVPLWLFLILPQWRTLRLPNWVRNTGYVFAIIFPLLFLRKGLPTPASNMWLPGDSPEFPATTASFYLLTIGIMLAGTAFCYIFNNAIKLRLPLLIFTLLLTGTNLLLTGVRLQTGLTIIVGLAAFSYRYKFRRWILFVCTLTIISATTVFIFFSPAALQTASIHYRFQIWKFVLNNLGNNKLLGSGYNNKILTRKWFRPSNRTSLPQKKLLTDSKAPLPKAYHTHNLWLQLLIERGIVGIVTFHILWLTCLSFFLVWLFKTNDSTPAKSFEAKTFVFCITMLLFLLVLDGLFNVPIHRYNEILYWFFAALGLATCNIEAKQISPESLNTARKC